MVFAGTLLNTNKNKISTIVEEDPITLLDTDKSWLIHSDASNFTGPTQNGSRKGYEVVISKDGTKIAYYTQYNDGYGATRYYKYTGSTLNHSGSWAIVNWNGSDKLSSQVTSARGNESDRLGAFMAMSYNGNTVALVAPTFEQFRGKVEIWKTDSDTNPTNLTQKGSTLTNGNVHYQWGGNTQTWGTQWRGIALSGDGNIVVIGEMFYNEGQGRFLVYEYVNNDWSEITTVDNHATNILKSYGREISCSETADVILVGNPNDNRSSLYRRNGNNWNLEQDFTNNLSGHEVAVNDAGNIIAICCVTTNGNTGSVEVWKYNSSTSSWELLGNRINGNVNGYPSGSVNYFGQAIGLSSDGYKLATGSGHYHVNGVQYVGGMKMFQYNPTTDTWDDLGNPNIIIGTNQKETTPNTIRMTSDGTYIVMGAFEYLNGEIRYYRYNVQTEPINYLDPFLYSRNVQTFQYSGTFIMSMNDASWDGVPPLSNGYDTDSNITYTITTSSSGGITTVYVAYQYVNTFDPTSITTVPGLRLNGKTYYYNMNNNNFTIIQFDYIPLDKNQGQLQQDSGNGINGITILANDQPYIQKNTDITNFYRQGKTMPNENYEWVSRLDTTNCTRLIGCFFQANNNNVNLNGWNVNNDVPMEILLAAYNALEKMVELGYNPRSYNNQNFPDVPELQIYRDIYPKINTNGVTTTGGANIINSMNSVLRINNNWNNGRDPYVPNLLTWVFCNKNQDTTAAFQYNSKMNIAYMEPFLAPAALTPLSNYYNWNNGFAPGEYWSLKDHKWSFAMCRGWSSFAEGITGFAGDFAGIRAPPTQYCSNAFKNCSSFNSDLTDMILSWQYTNININNIISGCGLSVENYSKFLIAIKQSYDNNNSRFDYNNFTWNINQYYNSSASSARNALEAVFPNKITDLGLQ